MKNKDTQKSSEAIKQKIHKERRFPKFGILDAVIILLVIAIVVGIYFRYSFFDTLVNMRNMKECYVTFKTENVTVDTTRSLYKDDLVYLKSDGTTFGNLAVKSEEMSTVIQEQPATSTFVKDGNVYSDIQYPQGIDGALVYGTGVIKCSCLINEDGSYILNGSTYISIGQTYTVCTEKVTLDITITQIETIIE